MKILFMANLIPFPADNGGKIKTLTDLRILSSENEVDFIGFYEHEDIKRAKEELTTYCNSIQLIPIRVTTRENVGFMIKKAIRSLFSKYSLGTYKYLSTDMKSCLAQLLSKKKYDYVYCNILAMYVYADLIRSIQPEIKVLLAEQNCEALIYERMKTETQGLVKKIFLSIEYKKLARFEKNAITNSDKVIVLSKADKIELEKLCKNTIKCEIIPIGMKDCALLNKQSGRNEKFTILFVGTLTWQPNNAGLIWFLENVVPKIDFEFKMIIVGKNPSEQVKNSARLYKNIEVTGYVDSVDPYYEQADCMVVPLFIGSGQRVKIIESFAKGMPVIATSIGAEGLGYTNNKNICIANNTDEFLDCLNKMKNKEFADMIADNARTFFEENFEESVVTKKMLTMLTE